MTSIVDGDMGGGFAAGDTRPSGALTGAPLAGGGIAAAPSAAPLGSSDTGPADGTSRGSVARLARGPAVGAGSAGFADVA